jgi:hypothetical protein
VRFDVEGALEREVETLRRSDNSPRKMNSRVRVRGANRLIFQNDPVNHYPGRCRKYWRQTNPKRRVGR